MKKLFVALVMIIFGAAVYSESLKLGNTFSFTFHQFDNDLSMDDFISGEVTSIQPLSDGYYCVEVGKYKLTVKAGMEFNSFSGTKTELANNISDKPKRDNLHLSRNIYYNLCIIKITDVKPNLITYEIKQTNKQLVYVEDATGYNVSSSHKLIDVTE